ncbi:MAG: alanine racemase [Oscillospiraceae bacterium]|nr:alanine racemase [Oscillospiraceae bacterium]
MSSLNSLDGRVWAEIDLSALEYNARRIKSAIGGAMHMAVVKANAYGHGAVKAAQRLGRCGADWLAVACLSEALELRQNGIKLPILIMGCTPAEHADMLADNGIAQAVFDLEYAKALSGHLTKNLRVHIKVNSGMNRLGVTTAREVSEIARLRHFIPEGIFTHLAEADKPGFTGEQIAAFKNILKLVDINFQITHCANSQGMLYCKESLFDMARTGIVMYGAEGDPSYKPVMRVCARIAQISRIGAGQAVGYGRAFTAKSDMKIAVVGAGYADGYPRSLSNRGLVDCNGALAPVIGRVCMDMFMADVSAIPNAKAGDTVTLFGSETLSAVRAAELAGTISYELLCAVGGRVPRIYLSDK